MRADARVLCALCLILAPASGVAAPAWYELDPAHSFVHFEVLHFGTSTLRGRFGPVRGTVRFDPAGGPGYVGVEIDVASVDTGVAVLDRRLRGAEMLDTAAHPTAWFVSENFRFDAGRLVEVRGEFTLRGTGRPLSLRAQRFGCRPGPDTGTEVCGGDFVAELDRSSFGVDFGLPFVADRVRLLIQVEGRRR